MKTETDGKRYSSNSEGFDLSVVIEPFQKIADDAANMIKTSGKRPITLIEDYLNTKIKNDPLLVKQLLRIYFSTYTNEPINAGLLAPSSEGKTYATVEVAEIFPKSDIISIGRMSPTALIHAHGILVDPDGSPLKERIEKINLDIFNAESEGDKNTVRELKQSLKDIYETARTLVDLTHKILLFLDNPRPETYEVLKPIMSHDKNEIIYRTTKSDGSLSVKETIIKGWPAVIVCSAKNEAKNEVWAEIVSREIILSPNTDVSKYLEANKLSSQKFGVPDMISNDMNEKNIIVFLVDRLIGGIIKLCKDGNPILNPFAEKISELFPHNEGITMRHFKRLMAFINVETMLNAYSLMKVEFQLHHSKEKKYFVIPSLKIISNTIIILGNISSVPPEKIKFYENVFIPLINDSAQTNLNSANTEQQLINQYESTTYVTKEQVAEKYTAVFHKTITSKHILDDYLKFLADEGILDYKENPDNRKQHLYYISSKLTIYNLENIIRQLNANTRQSSLYIWSCLAKPLRLAGQIGKTIRLFDTENNKINFYDFSNKILDSFPKKPIPLNKLE